MGEKQQPLTITGGLSPTKCLLNCPGTKGTTGEPLAQLCSLLCQKTLCKFGGYLLIYNSVLHTDLQDYIKQNKEMFQVSHLK